jgi:ATP-dependent DNA ligase
MALPIKPPFAPMEAESVGEIPASDGPWQYEPKWDGFRCLAFRDGADIHLQSKSGQDLTRYFPEVTAMLAGLPARRFVIDGELVVPVPPDHSLSFDALLQRIHPAESRVKKLAAQTPAHLVLFDILVNPGGTLITREPLESRREALEGFARENTAERLHLSPMTRDIALARRWFRSRIGGLDGVVAKCLTSPYEPGERSAMRKIKNIRTADCVVGGFRYGSKERLVGSLLLGLFDGQGKLDHVGYTSSMPRAVKKELTKKLEGMIKPPGFSGRAPGGPSRWSRNRASDEWFPLEPSLVVEVQFDHFSGHRFRHGTRFLRWRPDKAPEQCTLAQLGRAGGPAMDLIAAAKPRSASRTGPRTRAPGQAGRAAAAKPPRTRAPSRRPARSQRKRR